jgi:hypothetical protein
VRENILDPYEDRPSQRHEDTKKRKMMQDDADESFLLWGKKGTDHGFLGVEDRLLDVLSLDQYEALMLV